MISVCTVPARGGRSCEHFGGYKTINRIPLPLLYEISEVDCAKFYKSKSLGDSSIFINIINILFR